MNTMKPMPLTAGLIRLDQLRGSINTLAGPGLEKHAHGPGLDFPSFDIPHVPAGFARQPQRKPAPIDLRMRVDLRDIRLYVDVIVDMLLQSLDGRAYPGGPPQSGGFSRRLASNPEVRRVLDKLLERADKLKAGGSMSAEEIIRALTIEVPPAGVSGGVPLKLPLSLKNIAVTREKSANQSRLGRRERLAGEARKLVFAQLGILGQKAEIITKHKDSGSSLHIAVPGAGTVYHDTGAAPDDNKSYAGRSDTRRELPRDGGAAKKTEERRPDPAAAPQSFTAAKVEYLQSYRRANEQTTAELAEKLVDAKTLARLSGEAAASLNRMLEQGKLIPAKAAKPLAERAGMAEAVTTYATLHPGGRKSGKTEQGYNITVKNLYYTEKMPGAESIRLSVLPAVNPRFNASPRSISSLRHAVHGHGSAGFSGAGVITERKIPSGNIAVQSRGVIGEQGGQSNPAMFFAEAPAAAAAARIEARQAEQARQAHPAYDAPDMAKLKNELAKQAGKELDDIIKKKLNVDKLTDRIYRNLENRLRSERIRRGIT